MSARKKPYYTAMEIQNYINALTQAGVVFEAGLSAEEIQEVESRFGFRFPVDLREFLVHALPVSSGFVDWRHAPEEKIREQLAWPLEGMCFDIEQNAFWPDSWGPRPKYLADAFTIAARRVAAAPVLIPIAGHRYIPDRPHDAGNPVFSVYQTDIIYYGRNLWDYLETEFRYYFRESKGKWDGVREIEFWSELVE